MAITLISIGAALNTGWKWLGKHRVFTISVLFVTLILFNIWQAGIIRDKNRQIQIQNQNIAALTDTLRVTQNKIGQIEYNKIAFLAKDIADLKKVNAELAEKVKNIKGKVETIIESDIKFVHDTTYLPSEGKYEGNIAKVNFSFDSTFSKGNYRIRRGFTQFDTLTKETRAVLTEDITAFSALTGIKKVNDKYEIFFTPNYPGAVITDLQGAKIDPSMLKTSTKRFNIRFGGHIGLSPVNYSLPDKSFDFKLRFVASGGINVNF